MLHLSAHRSLKLRAGGIFHCVQMMMMMIMVMMTCTFQNSQSSFMQVLRALNLLLTALVGLFGTFSLRIPMAASLSKKLTPSQDPGYVGTHM